jgi:hypothetical protein
MIIPIFVGGIPCPWPVLALALICIAGLITYMIISEVKERRE